MGGDGWGLHFIMCNCVIVLWHSWVYLFHTLSAKENILPAFLFFKFLFVFINVVNGN